MCFISILMHNVKRCHPNPYQWEAIPISTQFKSLSRFLSQKKYFQNCPLKKKTFSKLLSQNCSIPQNCFLEKDIFKKYFFKIAPLKGHFQITLSKRAFLKLLPVKNIFSKFFSPKIIKIMHYQNCFLKKRHLRSCFPRKDILLIYNFNPFFIWIIINKSWIICVISFFFFS